MTYAAATALIGVSVVAIAAAVLIDGGRRRETAARVEAESNFDMAQQAVDDYLTKVSENTLLKEQNSVDIRGLAPRTARKRPPLLQAVREPAERRPVLRRRLATAYFRVGQITGDIGSGQDAIAAYQLRAEDLGIGGGGQPRRRSTQKPHRRLPSGHWHPAARAGRPAKGHGLSLTRRGRFWKRSLAAIR